MAKKGKSGSKRKRRMSIPLAVVGGFLPLGATLVGDFQTFSTPGMGGMPAVLKVWAYRLSGYSADTGRIHFDSIVRSYMPMGLGILVHNLAGHFGVNRILRRYGSPIVI